MASGGGSTRGRLPDEQYNKIQDNFVFLIDHIKHNPICVADSLFEKHAFNEDDMEEVEKAKKDSKRAAAKKILNIVLGCGHTGYDKFIAALHDNGYYDAVFELEPSYKGHRDDKPGHRDDKPGITTHDALLTGFRELKSELDEFRKGYIDLLDKRSTDSHRLRTMKGEALEHLGYVKDKKYVKTRALDEGLRILKNHHILGIVGAAGDGKTVLSMMIANQFIEECQEYKPLLINDLDNLKEVNFENDKYLYIIDDMYGRFNTLPARIEQWPTYLRTLRVYKEQGKLVIIYVMRDYIYNSSKYQLENYDLFVGDVFKIFLREGEFSLNKIEKKNLLKFYRISSDEIISKITDCFGFPSIVSLCTKLTSDELPENLDSSHRFLLLQLETFWKEHKYIYAMLVLVFCLHKVSEKDLKQRSSAEVESLVSTITKEVCAEFELQDVECKLYEFSESFIKYIKENRMKIFSLRDFVEVPFLHHLSGNRKEMALQYCSVELLKAVVRTYQQDNCIEIHKGYFDELSMRFLKELHTNSDIIRHPAFIDCAFLSHFLGRNDIGLANLLHNTKFINLGNIREIQESGNFLHYITLHGDMGCLEAALSFFHDQLPQIGNEKTDMGWDIIGLAAVSMHNPIKKMNLLKEKNIGDLLALPHLAVYSDEFEIVEHISNFTNFDKSKRDNKSRTVLHNACDSKHDNSQIINFLIDMSFDVNATDENGSTPLHLAVARGKKQTVSILISQGARVNAKDNMSRLPIHIVCSSFGGRTDVDATHILNQLIQAESLLYEADDLGRIPLIEIISNSDIKCFELLINEMISFDILNKYIQTMIVEATKLLDNFMLTYILDRIMPYVTDSKFLNKNILFMCYDSVDKMRILHNKGTDFNVVDENNCSILHYSCRLGSIDTVHYLVNEIGLNINQKDKTGRTPVFYSVMSDIDPIKKLEFLLSRGCSLQVLDDNNCSLLHISCGYGELETVEYLVNRIKLDVHHKDNDGNTPVVFCSASNINPVSKLKFLSSKGVSLHTVDNNNNSLLHVSCRDGTIETVEYLVNDVRLDVHHKNNIGITPAIQSSLSNDNPIKKLQFLTSKGVSLSDVVGNNMSLLHFSCGYGTIETLEYLVNDMGLDVHHRSNEGFSPAILCCMSEKSPVSKLKLLSSKGVNLHTVDNNKIGLLHLSCGCGTIETVKYLVNDIRLDVHHKDNDGRTPAMCCCMDLRHLSCQDGTRDTNGRTPAIHCSMSDINPVSKLRFLSSQGANLHAVDNDNISLLHFSCQFGNIETVEYLVDEIGLDVHQIGNNGLTPATSCASSSISPIGKLKFLTLKGANLHAVDNDNVSLLEISCRFGNIETVEYLVNDIELGMYHRGNNWWPLVLFCCISTKSPVSKLKFLSTKGVSLYVISENMSFLHHTCWHGITETVKFLVNEIGLDINQRSEGISTPLLWCFKSNVQQMEKINFLISKGAKIIICRPYQDDMTDEGDYGKCCYPLHHSCYLGTLDTVKWLVNDAGYDVNYTDDDNMIALLWSFKTKIQQQEKIRFIIFKDAKITICRPYQDGMTDEDDYGKCNYPLHHSCYLGTLDTVKLLVNDAGYDVNYTDDDNMTALLWSFKTKIQQQEKIKFLIFKGAKITIHRPYKDLFNNIP